MASAPSISVGGSSSSNSGSSSSKVSTKKKTESAKPSASKSKSSKTKTAPNPREKSTISKGANKAEQPNAMAEGIKKNWKDNGLETSDGNKLGQYKKTGEGTIEKELLKKGFTLKDIYTKDKQGRTLADQVAQTNGIKNQKKIADGRELTLPQRPGAQGVASNDLKNGEKKAVETVNGNNSARLSVEKGEQGNLTANQSVTANGNNTLDVESRTGPGGSMNGSTHQLPNGQTGTNLVTHSANNKAITESQAQTRPDGSVGVNVRDVDGAPNSSARVEGDQVKINNPDGATGGNDTNIKLGPQSWSESFGRVVDRAGGAVAPGFFKPQQLTGPQGPVGDLRQVDGEKRQDGSAHLNLRGADGSVQGVDQTPRGTVQDLGKRWSDTLDGVGQSIKNFWGGSGPSTPNAGIPAEQIFSPSGTII